MKRKIVIIFVATIFLSVFFVKSEIMKTDSEHISEAETIGTYENTQISKCDGNTICNFNSQIASVSAGLYHTLISTKDGIAYSLGRNTYWTLGINSTNTSVEKAVPTLIANNTAAGFTNDGSDPIVQVSAGAYHGVILTESGWVYTFGRNASGQLGNNAAGDQALPVKVVNNAGEGFINGASGDNKIVSIAGGYSHTAMLTASGIVYTFGANEKGQLGNTSITPSRLPVKVAAGSGFANDGSDPVVSIAAGEKHTIMATASGKIYTFGGNEKGQLGNGTANDSITLNPSLVTNSTDFINDGSDKVVEVSAIFNHSIIRTASGKVYTFGYNRYGQLGNSSVPFGATTSNSALPVAVSSGAGFINDGSDPVVSIAGGYSHTMMVTASGKVYTFGYNSKGQLGNTGVPTGGNSLVPVLVEENYPQGFGYDTGDKVVKVETLMFGSLILTDKGSIYGFGDNDYGQLGIEKNTIGYKLPINGTLFSFTLNGKAITHSSKVSDTNKYSTDVVVKHVSDGATVELSLDDGTSYTDVTNSFVDGEYTIGNAGTFLVNAGEEKEMKIKVTKDSNVQELKFIIDKKPPTITEIIGSSGSSVCNVIDNTYYCNKDVGFTESDLSGFYSGEKESDLGTEDITANIAAGLVNSFGGEILEKQKVIYTLIDGAGNPFTTNIILDNYIPRNELK